MERKGLWMPMDMGSGKMGRAAAEKTGFGLFFSLLLSRCVMRAGAELSPPSGDREDEKGSGGNGTPTSSVSGGALVKPEEAGRYFCSHYAWVGLSLLCCKERRDGTRDSIPQTLPVSFPSVPAPCWEPGAPAMGLGLKRRTSRKGVLHGQA